MRKTGVSNMNDYIKPITVDRDTLAQMLCVGINKADEIGTSAGAVIRFGKRKVYSVKKIEEYIEFLTDV